MEVLSPYHILIDAGLQYKEKEDVSSRLTLPEDGALSKSAEISKGTASSLALGMTTHQWSAAG
jgi:hypothetical protein